MNYNSTMQYCAIIAGKTVYLARLFEASQHVRLQIWQSKVAKGRYWQILQIACAKHCLYRFLILHLKCRVVGREQHHSAAVLPFAVALIVPKGV